MSEQTAEAAATETEATEQQTEDQKPSETVDFWKQKAREQEKRAKSNADAAKRLSEMEDAQKSEIEKANERVTKAETEVASVPTKVADALREHLVELHEIDQDDAELFLTATEPELLLKQVKRLMGQSEKRIANGNRVPKEGTQPTGKSDPKRDFLREIRGEG